MGAADDILFSVNPPGRHPSLPSSGPRRVLQGVQFTDKQSTRCAGVFRLSSPLYIGNKSLELKAVKRWVAMHVFGSQWQIVGRHQYFGSKQGNPKGFTASAQSLKDCFWGHFLIFCMVRTCHHVKACTPVLVIYPMQSHGSDFCL